jgi:hypothetical protein
MTGPTYVFDDQEGEPTGVTHETFARAAISKVFLPPDAVHVQYAIANALIAIYGVLAEISAHMLNPMTTTDSTEVDSVE